MRRRPPSCTLFPYTTLFRSVVPEDCGISAFVFLAGGHFTNALRSEEHTSELQSHSELVCRLLLEKKNTSTRGGVCMQLRQPVGVLAPRRLLAHASVSVTADR